MKFPSIGGLMVSKMITDENIKPRFMYREKRINLQDSGWRIFTGFESEEYLDNPENAGIYNPSTILEIDPSIEKILLEGFGSVYERSSDDGDWHKVTDFEMDDDFMITDHLNEDWTININNLFERRLEDSGDLLYTTGDKSVRISIWNKEDLSKEELYVRHTQLNDMRDQTQAKTLQTFDLSDSEIGRVGYLIREDDGEKNYAVIYGFTIVDHQTIQLAFYFDDDEDLNWAVDTWKSIKR